MARTINLLARQAHEELLPDVAIVAASSRQVVICPFGSVPCCRHCWILVCIELRKELL